MSGGASFPVWGNDRHFRYLDSFQGATQSRNLFCMNAIVIRPAIPAMFSLLAILGPTSRQVC